MESDGEDSDGTQRNVKEDDFELPRVIWVPDKAENQEDFLRKSKTRKLARGLSYSLSLGLLKNWVHRQTTHFGPRLVPKQPNHPVCYGIHSVSRINATILSLRHLRPVLRPSTQESSTRIHQADALLVGYVLCRPLIPPHARIPMTVDDLQSAEPYPANRNQRLYQRLPQDTSTCPMPAYPLAKRIRPHQDRTVWNH